MLDPIKNFAISEVETGIDDNDTTLALATGGAARFPDPVDDGNFNIVIWNFTDYPNPAEDPDVEVLRVIGVSGDDFTIVRAQEDTAAAAHNTGGKVYKVIQALTKQELDRMRNVAGYRQLEWAQVFNGAIQKRAILFGVESLVDDNAQELATNPDFTGNADGWTPGTGWAYNDNGVEFDPESGSELATNGSFTTDSDPWTLGAGWSFDTDHLAVSENSGLLEQDMGLEEGKSYIISILKTGPGGYIHWKLGTPSSGQIFTPSPDEGTIKFASQANGSDGKLYLEASWNGELDDVSVKEIPNGVLSQTIAGVIEGRLYRVRITWSGNTYGNTQPLYGSVRAQFGDSEEDENTYDEGDDTQGESGTHDFFLVADATGVLKIITDNVFNGKVESVSVKEVLEARPTEIYIQPKTPETMNSSGPDVIVSGGKGSPQTNQSSIFHSLDEENGEYNYESASGENVSQITTGWGISEPQRIDPAFVVRIWSRESTTQANQVGASVLYGTQEFTLAEAKQEGDFRIEIWVLTNIEVDSEGQSENSVTINFTGEVDEAYATITTYYGVDQDTPVEASESASDPDSAPPTDVQIDTTTNYARIIDAFISDLPIADAFPVATNEAHVRQSQTEFETGAGFIDEGNASTETAGEYHVGWRWPDTADGGSGLTIDFELDLDGKIGDYGINQAGTGYTVGDWVVVSEDNHIYFIVTQVGGGGEVEELQIVNQFEVYQSGGEGGEDVALGNVDDVGNGLWIHAAIALKPSGRQSPGNPAQIRLGGSGDGTGSIEMISPGGQFSVEDGTGQEYGITFTAEDLISDDEEVESFPTYRMPPQSGTLELRTKQIVQYNTAESGGDYKTLDYSTDSGKLFTNEAEAGGLFRLPSFAQNGTQFHFVAIGLGTSNSLEIDAEAVEICVGGVVGATSGAIRTVLEGSSITLVWINGRWYATAMTGSWEIDED